MNFLSSNLVIWMVTIFSISILLFSIASFFLKEEAMYNMKSKFESGMDSTEQEFPPFYMHFFYIGLLFLIFDVEMVISIPMISSNLDKANWILFWMIFITVIFIGLLVEISIDSVEWKE